MTPLPTLGGNNAAATGVNNRGDVVGAAENSVQDPSCAGRQKLDFYAVIWQRNGTTATLPPIDGDTVSQAAAVNNSGQVVGASGPCGPPFNNLYGTAHAVLWQTGSAIDLGRLGGKTGNAALAINDRGQVVGFADLPGDNTFHAFLWQRGSMADLGTLPGDVLSVALGINNKGQVVGQSCDAKGNCRAFIWQNGSMTDLNLLRDPHSPYYLTYGGYINDRGWVVGAANDAKTGGSPAFLALPSGQGNLRTASVSQAK
ncbi:MAG: hypothetical protein ABI231_02135 [Candidatus Tumulicola sp.]